MNILDENIPENQAALLVSWRIRCKQIGVNIGRAGMSDEAIIPLLLRQPQPTFLTRDKGFYDSRRCHQRYCLVILDVAKNEAASFVRRFMRHALFNSKAKRMGKVVRVSRGRIRLWELGDQRRQKEFRWLTVA